MAQKKRPTALQSPGIGACWLGRDPIFGFGDGRLMLGGKTFTPHRGGILGLAVSPNSNMIFTCGDDGLVAAIDSAGTVTSLHNDTNAWYDGIAVHEEARKLAVSAGREVLMLDWAQSPQLPPIILKPARSPTSLAFSGDGKLLAVSHSAGVSLFKLAEPKAVFF